jgi:hypothetical protein
MEKARNYSPKISYDEECIIINLYKSEEQVIFIKIQK